MSFLRPIPKNFGFENKLITFWVYLLLMWMKLLMKSRKMLQRNAFIDVPCIIKTSSSLDGQY